MNLTIKIHFHRRFSGLGLALRRRGACFEKRVFDDLLTFARPNKSLQRSWTHKVLGRGRPSKSAHERWRARVLRGRRAAAELGR